jgi:hypothetical protein
LHPPTYFADSVGHGGEIDVQVAVTVLGHAFEANTVTALHRSTPVLGISTINSIDSAGNIAAGTQFMQERETHNLI